MTHLFIGGCADGRRLSLLEKTNTVRVPVDGDIPTKAWPCTDRETTLNYNIYHSQKLAANGQIFVVYVYEKLTMAEAMRMLIEGYKQATEIECCECGVKFETAEGLWSHACQ